MKLILYLLSIAALWYVYIFLRFVFHRNILLQKVKRFAKEYDIDCFITPSAFLLPSNRLGTAVLLKTKDKTYNIRLFGLLRKNCAVHFWNKEMYSVEKYIPRMSLNDVPLGHRPVKRRKLGEWDISNDAEIPVLLYVPTKGLLRLMQTKVNHIERLMAGDMIEDVLFTDDDFLFRHIEKNCRP